MSLLASPQPFASASSVCRTCRLRILRLQSYVQQRQEHPQFLQRRTYWPKEYPRVANVSGLKSDDNAQSAPRWAVTPSAMRAPYRTRPKTDNDDYPVNEDPEKLKEVYIKFLGDEEAVENLPEHLRWLAVTHKSFDHGRRGFNDRLAFLGKRLVEMQTSLALVDGPVSKSRAEANETPDAFGRRPFTHEATKGLEFMAKRERVLSKERMAQLAQKYDLGAVIRWKPRQIRDLRDSGLDGVLAHTLYAIVGAVALQRGGEVATKTVRRRILDPLGVM